MKRFFLKAALLALLILSSVGILNVLYTRTNYWKSLDTSKFNSVPVHIQLANVGSSHGERSFDYQNVPLRSFNFALSSQRFLYDYGVIKQYIEHFDKNAVLLIPISYFQITMIKTDFRDQRARYYRFLDKQHMDYYSGGEKILFSFIPVLTADNTLIHIIKDIPPNDRSTSMTVQELDVYCDKKYTSWTGTTPLQAEMGEAGFSYNKEWVSKIIELCYAHDIQPVLVSTPITSILNRIYAERSPDFFDTFYRFTRELQEAYPSVPYFDYSHDSRFENDFPLFFDGDHLNAAGAEKFTGIVVSDLQAAGVIDGGS